MTKKEKCQFVWFKTIHWIRSFCGYPIVDIKVSVKWIPRITKNKYLINKYCLEQIEKKHNGEPIDLQKNGDRYGSTLIKRIHEGKVATPKTVNEWLKNDLPTNQCRSVTE